VRPGGGLVGRPAPLAKADIDNLLRPFGQSRSLPAAAYRSQEVFDWEWSEIFSRGWVCLGRTTDLLAPGQIRALDHGPESYLLTRDAEGEVRGFSNVCRHRGHPLAEPGEAFDARLIRCPYHSWSYRFDGTVRAAPTLGQWPDFDASEWPLSPVKVGEWMGWLFLDLSGEAGSLEETFGNLAEVLEPYQPGNLIKVARHSYEIAANWKLAVENYHECYHCTSIHPALCEVTPVDSGRDIAPTGLWCGGTMVLKDHAVTMSLTGESGGVNFADLAPGSDRHVLYLGLWPNLLISPHPDYVMTHRIVPIAPGRTFIECDWLFPPEALALEGFDPSYAVDFWDLTNQEDWNACMRVQQGAGNRGFAPGPLSPWESTIYQFLAMVGQAYLGEKVTAPAMPSERMAEATI
jgi:glycine betaine catabolism A